MKFGYLPFVFLFCVSAAGHLQAQFDPTAPDPLPSWNDTAPNQAIRAFVERVTTEGGADFVPAPERIAVFDNDGTLWTEAPLPFQAVFAFDEVKRRAAQEPAIAADPMVQAALAGDIGKLLEGKHHDGLFHILSLTHASMTTDEFDANVENWLASARHPRFDKPYTELTYQPMLELLRYLRANGFKTFIVSGGGADFMRVWTEQVYGIPPENVVGSTGQVKYELRQGLPTLVKTFDHIFVDDKEGKPVGIHQFIGRRPIACFGNSDGDQAMLEYTTIGNPHPSFGLIVHHTDAEREYAYDANPKGSGKLITALEVAPERGWTVVNMKKDWSQVWGEALDSQASSATKSLIGKWLAEDIAGNGVLDNVQSTLEIGEDNSVSGNTAVNQYRGTLTMDDHEIRFGPLAMTRRAGPPAQMEQESKFTAALARATQFRIDKNGSLLLLDAEGQEVLRFSELER